MWRRTQSKPGFCFQLIFDVLHAVFPHSEVFTSLLKVFSFLSKSDRLFFSPPLINSIHLKDKLCQKYTCSFLKLCKAENHLRSSEKKTKAYLYRGSFSIKCHKPHGLYLLQRSTSQITNRS